jgi:hypothetical protein
MTGTAPQAPSPLDHLVLAGPDLAALVAGFEERTGVRAVPGGRHPTGTANHLVALTVAGARGPQYLEIIGPDPDVEHPGPVTTFGIDRLTAPRLATFAVRPADLDATIAAARAAGHDPGDPWDLSRRTPAGVLLEWRLTRGAAQGPVAPFLIDWGGTAHPGEDPGLDALELVDLRGEHPDPQAATAALAALGVALPVERAAAPALVATLRGPQGDLELR